jgi:spoIIIJ-associated protein
MQEVERSAASVEEAIEAGLRELGISEQGASIEIVQEPRSGFLGLNAQPAIVRIRTIAVPTTATDDAQEIPPEETSEQASAVADFLEGLLDAMGMDGEVEISQSRGATYVDIWGVEDGDDMGLLIGKGGHTVDALQELAKGYVHRQTGERCLVQVDVEDYRKRRRSNMARTAREAATRVRKTGNPETMEPMPAFERKFIHDVVSEVGGLESASEGEEPRRRVVIRRLT